MSLEWWQRNIIYHIYLASFKDSNSDGVGDLQGLISKLDYFEELNVKTLLISPFYPSPMKDNGYDITSFVDVDPVFGSMADFDELMEQIKNRDMNVLLDFVANHTSDQHPWFGKSIQCEEKYTDFYVWADAKLDSKGDLIPPNNWMSVFGGSSWTWNEIRKQFYYHQFLPEQPDLNYRCPRVRCAMKKVLQFWLEKGVDGFRIDAAGHFFEDKDLRDEPVNEEFEGSEDDYRYLKHIYTRDMKENFELLLEWREMLDDFSDRTKKPKIMFTESFQKIEEVMQYYGTVGRKLADFPLNFQMYKIKSNSTGKDIFMITDKWLRNMPKGKYPNWVVSSHDDPRLVSRVGRTLAFSLQMLIMLLPGVPFCYYGDELGMENGSIRPEEIRDSFALRTVPENSRDPMRTPMQWNREKNAGFTDNSTPWLPVHEDYKVVNVEVQKENPTSFWNTFRRLIQLREEPAVLVGLLEYPLINEKIFSLLRFLIGAKCYLLVLNTTSKPLAANLTNIHPLLPNEAIFEMSSNQSTKIFSNEANSTLNKTSFMESASSVLPAKKTKPENQCKVPLNDIHLEAKEAIILSYIGAADSCHRR